MLLIQTVAAARAEPDGWNWIWKARAPPKAKHLMWRICKECVPTRVRLNARFVDCPLIFPICETENESDGHVIFDCAESRRAWQVAGFEGPLLQQLQQSTTAAERLRNICRSTDTDTAGKIAMLIWVLWNNRNNWVWNNIKENGQQLGYKAIYLWNEWNEVQTTANSTRNSEQQVLHWQKPQLPWLKCNVDAGFHQQLGRTSVGWCVRDARGSFVLAGSSWINCRCSVTEGEALAVLAAMKELHERGYSNVIFETDSQIVANSISSNRSGVSEFSSVVSTIRRMLSIRNDFKVKSIRRQANMVAHTLARAAVSWPSRCTFDLLPTCIELLIDNEMA
ncbi:hypothetical protein TSUD_259190 [Trifolium subterraneum]|uniref:Uncharacterized protein n=1 Tax=Trifolium subterraneum TaxID=3900 RepID=A0A2Z6NTK1_TRISU|nr:hypothetical protein TSUD_259190 [Trifolium subterraneum]